MRQNILYLLSILAIATLSVSCNSQEASTKNNSPSLNIDDIHTLLVELNETDKLKYESIDILLEYFTEFEQKNNSSLRFPYYDDDPELFYSLINRLVISAIDNKKAIQSLMQFRLTIRRITEWSQFLSEQIHIVALNNTEMFVKCYKELINESRDRIVNDLYWFNETGDMNKFIRNLDEIKDNSLADVILEIKTKLD